MKYPIIVGTDLSGLSDDALREAERRSSRDGVPLTVAHAVPPFASSELDDALRLDEIRRQIQKHVSGLTGRSATQFEVVIERGFAHAVLARLALVQRALLVVGNHMHHGIRQALLAEAGETRTRGHGPVLVARPRITSGRMLVAAAHPGHSVAALDVALDEAQRSGCRLTVLHCVNTEFIEAPAADSDSGARARPSSRRALLTEASVALRQELQGRGLKAELRVVEGAPQALISEFADHLNVELVVVGASRNPASLANVTAFVLRNARCSALVVDEVYRNAAPRAVSV